MQVSNVRPVAHQRGGRFRDVAFFDADVIDGFTVLGMKLSVAPDGRRFVFAPQRDGVRFARIRGDVACVVADMVWEKLGGVVADARH